MTATFTGLLSLGSVVSNVIKMNVCFGKGCKYMNSVLSGPIHHPAFAQCWLVSWGAGVAI